LSRRLEGNGSPTIDRQSRLIVGHVRIAGAMRASGVMSFFSRSHVRCAHAFSWQARLNLSASCRPPSDADFGVPARAHAEVLRQLSQYHRPTRAYRKARSRVVSSAVGCVRMRLVFIIRQKESQP